ncbi:hypothetical protein [Streptomyces sp. NPDC058674]|uniref:hypothetical protein n=1 Tax=Streptomyces sp. NPDC058674 TaxID=3346592 RepID=UPI003660DEB6
MSQVQNEAASRPSSSNHTHPYWATPGRSRAAGAELRGSHPYWGDGDPGRVGRTRLWRTVQDAPGGEPGGEPEGVVRLVGGTVVVEPEKGGRGG